MTIVLEDDELDREALRHLAANAQAMKDLKKGIQELKDGKMVAFRDVIDEAKMKEPAAQGSLDIDAAWVAKAPHD